MTENKNTAEYRVQELLSKIENDKRIQDLGARTALIVISHKAFASQEVKLALAEKEKEIEKLQKNHKVEFAKWVLTEEGKKYTERMLEWTDNISEKDLRIKALEEELEHVKMCYNTMKP